MKHIGGSRIQRDKQSISKNFESLKPRLFWTLRGYSGKQYMWWSQFIYQKWKQKFERKFLYILDSYFRQIASGQVTSFWRF